MDIITYAIAKKALKKIETLEKVTIKKVDSLPEVGEPNIIYLVPKESKKDDSFDEYMWIEEKWERVGSTGVDLDNYYTKEEIQQLPDNISLQYNTENGKFEIKTVDINKLEIAEGDNLILDCN